MTVTAQAVSHLTEGGFIVEQHFGKVRDACNSLQEIKIAFQKVRVERTAHISDRIRVHDHALVGVVNQMSGLSLHILRETDDLEAQPRSFLRQFGERVFVAHLDPENHSMIPLRQ